MDKVLVTLTVFFEDPFWVGVVERIAEGSLSASKITFGAEPKDYEVWDILLRGYDRLRFSPAVETAVKEAKVNPKRRQKEARRQTEAAGIGTKSQQALAAQREEQKAGRKERRRDLREERKRQQFLIKQEKKKQRHRGR